MYLFFLGFKGLRLCPCLDVIIAAPQVVYFTFWFKPPAKKPLVDSSKNEKCDD